MSSARRDVGRPSRQQRAEYEAELQGLIAQQAEYRQELVCKTRELQATQERLEPLVRRSKRNNETIQALLRKYEKGDIDISSLSDSAYAAQSKQRRHRPAAKPLTEEQEYERRLRNRNALLREIEELKKNQIVYKSEEDQAAEEAYIIRGEIQSLTASKEAVDRRIRYLDEQIREMRRIQLWDDDRRNSSGRRGPPGGGADGHGGSHGGGGYSSYQGGGGSSHSGGHGGDDRYYYDSYNSGFGDTGRDYSYQRGSSQDCSTSNGKSQDAQPAAVVTASPHPGGLKAAQPATLRAKPTSAATVPSTMKGIQPVKAGERPTVSIAKPAPGAMSTHPAAKVPPVSAKPGEKPQMNAQAAAALKAKHAAAGAWLPTRTKPLSQPRRQLAQGAGGSARA